MSDTHEPVLAQDPTGPAPAGAPPGVDTPQDAGTPSTPGPPRAGHPSDPAPAAGAAIAAVERERDDYLDALKRLQADFENYKKRIIRQQTEHLERAAEALVEKLLPVLDTFDLALVHGEGFDQVLASLMGVLEKEGLERIQPDGAEFDPNEHDAVAHEPRDDDAHGAEVMEVMRPGYRWKGRVVRPAMVKVKG